MGKLDFSPESNESYSLRGRGYKQLRTDILSGCPKEQGISLMLRTMSPQWIVVDEVTAPEDIQAMQHAGYCGVRLAATAHAADRRDLQSRALYRQLVAAQIFTKLITIRRDRKITVEDL